MIHPRVPHVLRRIFCETFWSLEYESPPILSPRRVDCIPKARVSRDAPTPHVFLARIDAHPGGQTGCTRLNTVTKRVTEGEVVSAENLPEPPIAFTPADAFHYVPGYCLRP